MLWLTKRISHSELSRIGKLEPKLLTQTAEGRDCLDAGTIKQFGLILMAAGQCLPGSNIADETFNPDSLTTKRA
jgi:hypothetical protein